MGDPDLAMICATNGGYMAVLRRDEIAGERDTDVFSVESAFIGCVSGDRMTAWLVWSFGSIHGSKRASNAAVNALRSSLISFRRTLRQSGGYTANLNSVQLP